MKTTVLLTICILALARTNAQEQFSTQEYGFKMNVPEGFEFETYEEGGFGIMEGFESESESSLFACAYIGQISKEDIYSFGVEATGIPENQWEQAGVGANENGFKWYEMYQSEYEGKALFAIVARNHSKAISYLFFVLAPSGSYSKYQSDYENWIESCRGL